jgi:TetR/AcrR family transcriptional repressor of nem operon
MTIQKSFARLIFRIRPGTSSAVSELPRSREATKRETRDALLRAGIEEFGERGFDAPSLDAICARAGKTRGAFYVHFRDREDFVVAVVETVLGNFLDAIIATGDRARDLEETVRRFAGVVTARLPDAGPLPSGIAHAYDEVQLHRLLEACARSPRLRERFAALLVEAIRRVGEAAREARGAGTLRSDVDVDQLGALLVAIALGAISAIELGVDVDPDRASETLLALLARRGE